MAKYFTAASIFAFVAFFFFLGFAQDYGAYLEADAVAAAASCREMEWALREALDLAEQCGNYRTRERYHARRFSCAFFAVLRHTL